MSLSFFLLIGATRVITGEFPADCGCFGENSLIRLEPQQVFVMDGVNFLIALKLASLKRPIFSLDRLLT